MKRRLLLGICLILCAAVWISACAHRAENEDQPLSADETTGQAAVSSAVGEAHTSPASSASLPSETKTTEATARQTVSTSSVSKNTTASAGAATEKSDTTALQSTTRQAFAAVWTEGCLKTADIPVFRYYLYTPADPEPGMPLIVYLHGGSGKGDDLERLTEADGFPRYLQTGELGDVRAYVVIPQLPAEKKGWADGAAALYTLVDTVAEHCGVDRTRMSLTGHSMGGTGSWSLAVSYPGLFARVAPLSGSIRYTKEAVQALLSASVWAFVGSADTIVPPQSSRAFVTALQQAGGSAKLTELSGADHFAVPNLAYLAEDGALLRFLTFA